MEWRKLSSEAITSSCPFVYLGLLYKNDRNE